MSVCSCEFAKVQSHSSDSLLGNLHESYNIHITGSSGYCGCCFAFSVALLFGGQLQQSLCVCVCACVCEPVGLDLYMCNLHYPAGWLMSALSINCLIEHHLCVFLIKFTLC